ncbi:ABC transporter substrate-binding protein [Legionella dresdenensis]|uniref:ABC transporter substrate-binding protein n=1 Tax=Legionella dresdenensis TaxID=450200 RepID=A0ABV8CFC9_9GAMM
MYKTRIALLLAGLLSHSCAQSWVLNNPYPAEDADKKIYYSSFTEQPKTLDPARSYSSNEYQFIAQIYEPVLQYDYYIRPYKLVPSTAAAMPEIRYLNKLHQPVAASDDPNVAYSVYTIHIKPGLYYQPHPALAKDEQGQYRYLDLNEDYLEENDISQLADFKYTGTREVVADDYIYEIKRLASPAVNSSIYGLMSEHITGFREFAASLPEAREGEYLDLKRYSLAGVFKIDDYTFEITLKGVYPQFMFWLAMPFFSPIPWEADKFYSQPGMEDKNLTFDWYPIGTGPFMLTENNPNRRMVLHKNPNFRQEFFPGHGSSDDISKGYQHQVGERLPLIEQAVYTLEKESIPRWNKFLQGYYDLSGISAESFDQAIRINQAGKPVLTPEMRAMNIRLTQTTDPTVYYLGFNMLDPVVGGRSERARKLRQAISIAVNYDENITIFFNGRGLPAQGPVPPGIFGYKEGKAGINPYVYRWADGKRKRRSINDARQLMKAAGYPGGHDPKTGRALILHYDVPVTGGPDDKTQLDWMRKQFAKIGIDLNIRGTQYNRFQEKMRNGNAQIFSWGWNADYPDPENFLFTLYGLNGKVKHGGENAANYDNPAYNKLFDLMKNRPNDPQRQQLIDQMVEIARHDAPWVWGINTQSFILSQQWISAVKPNTISLNTLKYISVDVEERNRLRALWNKPVLWPIGVFVLLLLVLLLPLFFAWRSRQNQPALRSKS